MEVNQNMKKKRFTIAIVLMVCLVVLISCSKDSGVLRVQLKNEELSNWGYAAVVYEDRIYYVSNELGNPGVYSMNMDGTDIQVEVSNPNITSLQIQGDVIYYTGIFQVDNSVRTVLMYSYRNTLYQYRMKSQEVLQPLIDIFSNLNVSEFYISSEEYIVVLYGADSEQVAILKPIGKKDEMDGTGYWQKVDLLDSKVSEVSFECSNNDPLEPKTKVITIPIYQFGDLLIIGNSPQVFNNQTGEVTRAFNYTAECGTYVDEDIIYYSFSSPEFPEERLILIDRNTYEIKDTLFLEDALEDYQVSYITKYNEKLYLVAEQWKFPYHDGGWLEGNTLLGTKVLILDPETLEYREILSLGEKERIIELTENRIVHLADGAVYKRELKEEQVGEKVKLVDLPEGFKDENYTVDFAGDWMFLYKSYGDWFTYSYDTPVGQQLVYKVNVESGEVIRNEKELNFSKLNAYRVN